MNKTPPPADEFSPERVADLIGPKIVWHSPIDPMPHLFTAWSLICLASLMIGGSLSPAMRGAFVGSEDWIVHVDLWGARSSQLAAIVTMLLLVHFALTSVRVARSKLLSLGTALLGSIPAMFLLLAQKQPLPHAHSWRAALCAALVLILCSQIARDRPRAKWLAFFSGLALLSSSLTAAQSSSLSSQAILELLLATEALGCWSAVGLLVVTQVWRARRQPWLSAGLLGLSLLLAQTAPAASLDGTSTCLLLIGRAVSEVSPYSTLGSTAPLALSLALISTIASVFDRLRGDALICSFLALGVVVPATPLVISWLTLCAYFLVVLGAASASGWTRQETLRLPLEVAS